MRTASGTSRVMTSRDEIDALLTRIGIIMEDGTECLLSRGTDVTALAELVAETCARVDTLKVLIGDLRAIHDQLSAERN